MNTVKKALEHLAWRFENGLKPTENDVKAYNKIAEYYEEQNKKDFYNNILFAKLYVIYYGELLKYYEGTVFDKMPQQELHRELDKPWSQIVEEFIDKHHDIEMMIQVPKELRGLHPRETKYQKFVEETGFNFKKVDKIDYKEAEQNLTNLINLALNTFK